MEWMRLGPMLEKISGCAPKAKLFHKPVEKHYRQNLKTTNLVFERIHVISTASQSGFASKRSCWRKMIGEP
jgi:hypothetical protein